MILDAFLMFDVAAAITANGTTQASTNVLDFGGPAIPSLANLQGARDMGIGDNPALKLLVEVTTVFAGGTSMSVAIQGATDNGSGVPAAFSTWWISPAYTTATLVVGARLLDMDFPRPPAGIAIPRFVRLLYTTVGACNGSVSSGIVLDRDDQPYSSTGNAVMGGYPAGINVAN
jgi:hypothetical protein